QYHRHVSLVTSCGNTRVVAAEDAHALIQDDDVEFCFFVAPPATPARSKLTWDALTGHPLEATLLKYKDTVFRTELPKSLPSRRDDVETTIELTDDEPVAAKQFRLSPEMRAALQAWTQEMLACKMIRPSTSPYAAPTFCVKKKDGWRIVHDFRGINAKMRVPASPIPRKDDIYDAMSLAWWFSAMDLLWGFFQVRMRERDIPFTAFSTPDGLFEYLVTPMGLSSSPSSFNRLIQSIFKDMARYCRGYFDDVFVFTSLRSIEDHAKAVDRVLQRCEDRQLYVKLSKCVFGAAEIPCLGDLVGRHGVRMDPAKIKVIREWPMPKTKRQMQSFLGTCVYVSKFCPDFAELMAPSQMQPRVVRPRTALY
ncbi:TPA: hypothetical protein N0F65_001376, partial [Lagenidium giganteum]